MSTKAQDDGDRTTALGLARFAVEFFSAAIATDDAIGEVPGREKIAPMPVYFLIGQAIELALKAYLRQAGLSVAELRNKPFGHDLVALFERARAEGLSGPLWDQGDVGLLQVLNEPYMARELQYIRTGSKTLPILRPLTELTVSIIRAVIKAIPLADGILARRMGRYVNAVVITGRLATE